MKKSANVSHVELRKYAMALSEAEKGAKILASSFQSAKRKIKSNERDFNKAVSRSAEIMRSQKTLGALEDLIKNLKVLCGCPGWVDFNKKMVDLGMNK
ncbi:MAG: hypothetical protein Q4D57_06400 [Clostridia bacterium]|nr:hypothetical protein [Clostridia bacterium]